MLNDQVAGYVTLMPLAKEGSFQGKYPEIPDFNVFKSFQKQGVGGQLLAAIEDAAKSIP